VFSAAFSVFSVVDFVFNRRVSRGIRRDNREDKFRVFCGFLSLTAELAEGYAEVTERRKDSVFYVVKGSINCRALDLFIDRNHPSF